MKSVLENFACGNINPSLGSFKKGSKYGQALKVASDDENKLLSRLDDEARELFEQLSKSQLEVNYIEGIDKFIYGYRLGMLMMMEVFTGREGAIFGVDDFER